MASTAFVSGAVAHINLSGSKIATESSHVCAAQTGARTQTTAFASTVKNSERTFSVTRSNFLGRKFAPARSQRTFARTQFTVENKVGELLEDFLNVECDETLKKVLTDLADAIRTISYKVRTASCSATSCFNSFGDEQLAVDVLADNLLFDALRRCGVVYAASSEEVSDVVVLNEAGSYSVAFDPLDGSSIIDTNFAVGTIFGVWPGKELVGVTGRQQVAAGVGIYGPRTQLMLTVKNGTHEFLLEQDGSWVHAKEIYEIGPGKLFAPGNLRATMDNPGYAALVDYWLKEKYQLRYTGGMVPDVNQILIKGRGVFCNPASEKAPAKLRVLYEVAPLGLLIENAGGATSEGTTSVLDIKILTTEQRSQVCYGYKDEVKRFEEYLSGKIPALA
mmetsp:Transcript_28592/g.46340  ORF Transcript_28592/g.46340 Transcript_28592/m.46340 type:complete len:391 (+) Transcript_28592:92-1264(+)|eukprot:CAMPEP_0184644992 /NCGR_PEP_ID=MMETSP0308-20130426/1574_1 /TAXON_ID=38269 /ORGANISM="Gloeochaete witrockiana, Strain SAG 46.84" /LENGTH=390 /DNA_ID=CAMNT_0027073773 /DNA_START=71 /DNA_END=1243 /DNA_ORIENTATION=+